ncbi:class I SAM-dependent methyltransferase [Acetobacterium sp.]|uniref:class I SAM-dependent methyltransferase n=1 Tax=Acetobacterium sp. TaxID=1872094 RepID=UPI0027175E69|nr:methionine biosynthesis protein MetW [Acetobacterium sp.]MDO9493275.1 methionine biosynthesis protein MetW [Acetobacterium sp.]
MDNNINQEFDNKIKRLTKSKTYLDYCEEVYGYRMYLFNMMDEEQLDFVFDSIMLSEDDTVLDLGCGSGSILNALVKKCRCFGIGIDQLDSDAVEIENENSQYLQGDIDDFINFQLQPTVTLSVDSIYFSRDPEGLMRSLCGVKNNRIYLFYSQYLFDDHALGKRILQGNFTKVADILKKLKVPYEMIDYSKNERILYEKSLCALEKREDAFKNEGNSDLYEDKIKEQRMGKNLYDTGNASRHLYIIG